MEIDIDFKNMPKLTWNYDPDKNIIKPEKITYPLYCFFVENNENNYIKITNDKIYIVKTKDKNIEVKTTNNDNMLPYVYLNNLIDKKQYLEAIDLIKKNLE